MLNVLLIFVYLFAGILLQKVKFLPKNLHLSINAFIINISLPALALLHITKLQFSSGLWMPVATAWIVYVLAFIFFKTIQKVLHYDNYTLACITLCCGLFNSAFIGLPTVQALYGNEGLQLAILVDQPGSFLVLSTLGVITAVWYSPGKSSVFIVVRKILSFPPLWGFLFALVLLLTKTDLPTFTIPPLKVLAALLTPFALVSVGLQLKFNIQSIKEKEVISGLGYKLLIAPAAIFLLYGIILKNHSLEMKVSVLQAAMGPMISGAIIATNYGLNPRLASLLVGIGIPLSFVTIAGWYFISNM
jgi:predicted permease